MYLSSVRGTCIVGELVQCHSVTTGRSARRPCVSICNSDIRHGVRFILKTLIMVFQKRKGGGSQQVLLPSYFSEQVYHFNSIKLECKIREHQWCISYFFEITFFFLQELSSLVRAKQTYYQTLKIFSNTSLQDEPHASHMSTGHLVQDVCALN